MHIGKIYPNTLTFSNATASLKNQKNNENTTNKNDFLDKFYTSIKNSSDLNDTVAVPRTIFKGYLAFMTGTALSGISAMAKNKYPKMSGALNILSIGLIIFGTFSFVRPYLIKD